MKLVYTTAALALMSIPALAQTAPPAPPFVPWTVTQEENDAIGKFLADKPYTMAAPLIGWMTQRENQAAQEKAVSDAKAQAAAKAAAPAPSPESAH